MENKSTSTRSLKIVFLMFSGYDSLDIVGPYDVLSRIPGVEIVLAGLNHEIPNLDQKHNLRILSHKKNITEIDSADVLVLPGGIEMQETLENEIVLEWIRKIHATTLYTFSVCVGAFFLAAAGVLENKTVCTHWATIEKMRKNYPNVKVLEKERFFLDGKILSTAGVSAGIDGAFHLVGLLTNKENKGSLFQRAIQLHMEYFPKMPFERNECETNEVKKFLENLSQWKPDDYLP